jgi:tRNA A-37 threonylcarbamoyl transferase component Bud32
LFADFGGYNPAMEIPGYEIKRQIGQGGMATAYLAEQKSLGRQVVLKILDSKVRDTPETIERFLNEGRIIASLNHPHIITIFDIGQSEQDVYISMEYVEGGDLRQRMQHKVFAPVEAIDVIEKIAGGLALAHAQDIIHRDVKPGNILFRDDGTPLLSDFGIAKRLSSDADLTSTGMFLGSPNYMAPEQSEAGPIDGRADIYSLGIILYEMLTGQRAYTADSVIDVIVMHKKAPIPILGAGFEEFQELLNLMLAKNRQERFRDAESLLHFIAELRKTGAVKSIAQMNASPDIDITGEHDLVIPPAPKKARQALPVQRTLPLGKIAMVGMLVLCAVVWGTLIVIERRMQPAELPRAGIATSLDVVTHNARAPAPSGQVAVTAEEATQVADALLWLGRHSIEESRLTTPEKDNAYYYFSRLSQLQPGHAGAAEGIRNIAAKYAFLAEREAAESRFDEARSYIRIGLQLDPQNVALISLSELTNRPQAGFWGALASLFN